MKRDYEEDATYMKLKIKEVLEDLAIATNTIATEVKNIDIKQVRPLFDIEYKLVKLLEDMKKGV